MKKNNVAETAPNHADERLRDRRYSRRVDEIAALLRQLATGMTRWRFTGYDPATGIVTLEHDTPIITFTDDITLRLREEKGETIVSGRSASRVGSYDFGMNARNLRSILGALDSANQRES